VFFFKKISAFSGMNLNKIAYKSNDFFGYLHDFVINDRQNKGKTKVVKNIIIPTLVAINHKKVQDNFKVR
jgi:hypothetical protein